ncbi:MAG: ribosome silencing factor [Planctomycetota bacterium]
MQEGRATANEKKTKRMQLDARARAILCAQTGADNRGRDVIVLDMRELVKYVDYLVLISASSRRQGAAISDQIEAELTKVGETKEGIEGYELGNWIVLDYGDVIVHIFNDEKRDYYQLEHLWGDAPRVNWQRTSETTGPAGSTSAEQPPLT